jgi:hypothetical protein
MASSSETKISCDKPKIDADKEQKLLDSLRDESATWDAYNHLLRSNDFERMRKLLYKCELYKRSLDVPGDVVEVGVFKGTGLCMLADFMLIFEPGSSKRLVGFDVFDEPLHLADADAEQMNDYYTESNFEGITPETCSKMITQKGFRRERLDLVKGDVTRTCAEYCERNPGFRISFLLLDLDVETPTRATLEALWDRVVRGGIVVFDEYAIARWSESKAVDAFFADKDVYLKTIPWGRTPSAYVVKP